MPYSYGDIHFDQFRSGQMADAFDNIPRAQLLIAEVPYNSRQRTPSVFSCVLSSSDNSVIHLLQLQFPFNEGLHVDSLAGISDRAILQTPRGFSRKNCNHTNRLRDRQW